MVDSVNLIYFPHPTLVYKSKPIARVDENLPKLISRMFDLMYEHRGVGLAANQVNVPLRLFVANPSGTRGEGEEFAFLNPTISRQKGSEEAEEGCLSLPGVNAMVKRSKHLHLSAYDLQGREVEIDCEGYLARIIQHEIDHLDGVMFIDRLDPTKARAVEEDVEDLIVEFESKKRTGGFPSDAELNEELDDWLSRYA